MGSEGVVGEVGDCTLSLELEMLPEEAERRRDSSIVSSRLTLACEYGVVSLSRISTNLEDDMVVILLFCSSLCQCGGLSMLYRDGAIDRSNEATGLFC